MSKTGAPRKAFNKNLWDDLVKEYAREPLDVEVSGREIRIQAPTGKTTKALKDAVDDGQDADALYALLDEEDADHILAEWEDVPAQVLGEFLYQVMEEFGLVSEGNPRVSRS